MKGKRLPLQSSLVFQTVESFSLFPIVLPSNMNMKNFPKRLDSKTSYLRITVPENLDLALEGLIRKVLKEQPKIDDIYSFAADYFETLLTIRDKAGAKFKADQLCPFHSNEDAHEMIKIAGAFSKRETQELRRKNEEPLPPKIENVAKNKEQDDKVQDEKRAGKSKLKKVSKDETAVEQNKQATSKIVNKLPVTVKNVPDEEKKQTKLADKRSDDINLEQNTKKTESDDEKFLASDPIKELVEKELMEIKLAGKQKDIKESAATNMSALRTSSELTANNNIEEERKPADSIEAEATISDINGPLEKENIASKENFPEKDEENKNRNEEMEETEPAKEKEIKVENNGITQQASEKGTPDVKEEKEIKPINPKASDKRHEDMEGENKEHIKGTVEIDSKDTINLKNVKEEETEVIEETNINSKNTEEKISIADRDDTAEVRNPKGNSVAIESEEQTLTQEIQSEEKVSIQSTEMINETTDRPSETLNDVKEKEINKAIYSDTIDYSNIVDINSNVKEQEVKDVKTSEKNPLNEIKSEEIESKEPLNDQQTRVNGQIDIERETKSIVETATKAENSESVDGNKALETSIINIKSPDTKSDTKRDTGNIEMNNNQEPKAQEKKMSEDEAEPRIKTEATDITSPKEDEATKEVLSKTEEFNDNNAIQTKQQSNVTEQMKEVQEDESAQSVLKNDEESLETEETTEDNKDRSTTRNPEEPEETKITIKEIKTHETKLTPEQVININDAKPESESTVIQVDSKDNSLKEKLNDLSSADKKSFQIEGNKSETSRLKLISDATNPNEEIKSEKKEKRTNEHRVKTTEDALFGERTHDLEKSNESAQTLDKVAVVPQAQKRKISETQDEQVSQNVAESQTVNKKSAGQQEENARKLEDGVSTSLHLLSTNRSSKEKLNKALKPGISDTDETQSKGNKIESEKEPRKEKSENQAEDESAQVSESKIEREELSTENQIPEDDKTNSEKSKCKFESDGKKPEKELCTVVDVQQIPNEGRIDGNKLEEKCKPEIENTQRKESDIKVEEGTFEEERGHNITVEEADKTEESQEMSQPPAEIQIKTIQSHIYDTLQVPDAVTREYRIHNVPSAPMGALLNIVSSFQQSHEPKQELLDKEEPIKKVADVNKVINVSSSTELTETVTPKFLEHLKFDNLQSPDLFQNSKTATAPPTNASDQKELELDTQKNDSDDLLDVMTPLSDYSLNLSELSWQTINELFLDSEKRNSSLEKEENRHVTAKTSKTVDESDEIEEIIHKVVVFSGREAVPDSPRDLEANMQTSEEKKEDKPEGDSAESSSDSSNEPVSVNDDTPFISVEVKTVIETQILDDDGVDDENDYIRKGFDQKEIQPDMEIKVETTIDYGNEVETQSDSEPAENKMETTVGKRNSLKSSPKIQDKDGHDKPKDNSSTEQTTGGEGSSAESDSTISSTATEIKRTNFAKRNFSSTRSLLSTQSLDLEKKNSLVKTRSLSAFRHGVTDFEVWNAIEKELEEAATKIQSKFRGYKTRKKLQRENAVQITTEESSVSVTPVDEETKNGCQRSTGEFHDSIVLSEHPR